MRRIASAKHTKNDGHITILNREINYSIVRVTRVTIGKSTIQLFNSIFIATIIPLDMFNSYVTNYQRPTVMIVMC